MKPRAGTAIIITAALAVLFGALTFYYTGPEVVIEPRRIEKTLSNAPLRYVLVLPENYRELPPRSRPAVVAIPPYSIQPEAMEIICIEIARRGGACAIPDFFGQTRAESRHHMGDNSLLILTGDVLSIIAELRALPFVNPDKIGACGHSVGGTVTVLVGFEDHRLRAAVPIGMYAEFFQYPQNLLFLSGLYDEIHPPVGLLDNLTDMGVTVPDHVIKNSQAGGALEIPANRQTYGDFRDGSARQVSIIPTTDHFIETFDPFLIHELLNWYAKALDEPELAAGTLREWRRRVAALLFVLTIGALYVMAAGPPASAFTKKTAPRRPEWIIARVPAAALAIILAGMYLAARLAPNQRTVMLDLMIIAVLAHELVSHRVRGALAHGDRSAYRLFRSAGLVLAALGVGVIISFGLSCLSYFYVFPEMAKWYPVFALNMTVLFPLEVWGRLRPFLFENITDGVHPTVVCLVLGSLAVAAPGLMARGLEVLARELVITVRSRLRPLGARPAPKTSDEAPPGVRATPLKIVLAIVLMIILILIGYRRVQEGMLTWETGRLALISILRFAVLPFIVAALIIRAKAFRRLALLD